MIESYNPNDFIIRRMTQDDIPAGMRLKAAAGWNQTETDWRLYLDIGGEGCFVAERDGRVVGTVTTVSYGGRFSWIGMMLVDPEMRRKGIGTRLMGRAIEHLEGKGAIRLDATPLGKTVYDRLGFADEYGLVRMTAGSLLSFPAPVARVTPIAEQDFPSLKRLDINVFGADRSVILRGLVDNNPETSWKREADGAIKGFCTGRPGTNFYQVGPIVAESDDDAISVTAAALSSLASEPVAIDVPDGREAFIAWLMTCGFTVERPFIRMCRGENAWPGDPGRLYGICGPELG